MVTENKKLKMFNKTLKNIIVKNNEKNPEGKLQFHRVKSVNEMYKFRDTILQHEEQFNNSNPESLKDTILSEISQFDNEMWVLTKKLYLISKLDTSVNNSGVVNKNGTGSVDPTNLVFGIMNTLMTPNNPIMNMVSKVTDGMKDLSSEEDLKNMNITEFITNASKVITDTIKNDPEVTDSLKELTQQFKQQQ